MKLGIFTDSHYSSAEVTCQSRYNSRSLAKIRAAMAQFEAEGCARVICLGDLIDREGDHGAEIANLRAVAAVFDASPLPVTVVMGNHDAFTFTPTEFYAILGENRRPQTIRAEGITLLFLDACHFAGGVHYAPGDSDWTDTFYPHADALARELAAESEVYLFVHQNLDPEIRADHRLSNAAEIRSILDAAGNVRRVFQGHYHPGHENGRFVTFPAMCERDDAAFVVEIAQDDLSGSRTIT